MTVPLDETPRLSALPGPSRLVRISDATWQWLRAHITGAPLASADPSAPGSLPSAVAPTPPEAMRSELERAGILQAGEASALGVPAEPTVEENWRTAIGQGLASPVGIELVCLDGDRGWKTSIRVAGRMLLVIDQIHEVARDGDTIRLAAPSGTVLLGVATIEHLTELVEALVPQRPAFTDAEPAPVPEALADGPAVAEVQALVVASPTPEQTVAGGGSFYALGEDGEHLIVLEQQDDGAAARRVAPKALSTIIRLDLISAINHVDAVTGASSATEERTAS